MTPRADTPAPALSRRERQVMDILHRRQQATVAEIMGDLPDPPTYSAVRSVLRILGEKGLVRYREDAHRYVYFPAQPAETARETALAHLVRTYFGGSHEQAAAALLSMSDAGLSDADIRRLREMVRTARRNGR